MSLFYSQQDAADYADARRADRLLDQSDMQPKAFDNLADTLRMAAPHAAASLALTGHQTFAIVLRGKHFDQAPDGTLVKRAYDMFMEMGPPLYDWEEQTALTSKQAGAVARIAGKLTEFGALTAAGGVAGFGAGTLPTMQAGVETYRELTSDKDGHKPVDPHTARSVALGDSLTMAIAFATAAWQKAMWARMLFGAGANLATDIPVGIAQQKALKDYPEEADARNPLTAERVALSALFGLAAGVPKGPMADVEAVLNTHQSANRVRAWGGGDIPLETTSDRLKEIAKNGPMRGRYDDAAYDRYAEELERQHNIPPGVLLAIKNKGEKSAPDSTSPAGARGLMQIMPKTGLGYGLRTGFLDDERLNPWRSMDAAALMVDDLLNQYAKKAGKDRNDPTVVRAAIAHYNGGPKAGNAVIDGKPPPKAETQDYLRRTDEFLAGYTPPARPAAAEAPPRAVPDVVRPVEVAADAAVAPPVIPEIPLGVQARFTKSGMLDIANTDMTKLAAFFGDPAKPKPDEVAQFKAAYLRKVYGDAGDLVAKAAAGKGENAYTARILAHGLLAVSDAPAVEAKVYGGAARRVLLGKERPKKGSSKPTPETMLQDNMVALLRKAKTREDAAGIFRAAAEHPGKPTQAAVRVASLEAVAKQVDNPPKIEAEPDIQVEAAKELALNGQMISTIKGDKMQSAAVVIARAERRVRDAKIIGDTIVSHHCPPTTT